jgi:3'-phosphoadenosine 5'-phosphosulfate sulfotransferase (PAPS reductase)/FAD synthetase
MTEIAVWFSCGAASAVAAKKTIEMHPDANVRVVNNPVAEEHEDNRRFLRDVETWLGVEVEIAINKNWINSSADEVWAKRRYMSGIAGAPCTLELKKRARQQWENANPCDALVLGFTAEETDRAERFRRNERLSLLTPLIDLRLTKKDCFRIVSAAGIELPSVYKRGYPNANCVGCVKATSATYWNHVRRDSPEVFARRAELSRELGARLVRHKGERIFLDELPPDAKGAAMNVGSFECGLFCETD